MWEQDPDSLLVAEDLKPLEILGFWDPVAIESSLTVLEGGINQTRNAVEEARKANAAARISGDDVDPLELMMSDFLGTASTKLGPLQEQLKSAREEFVHLAKLFGETDASLAKIKPGDFLKDILNFAKNIDAKRKDKQEKLDKENRRKAKAAAKA